MSALACVLSNALQSCESCGPFAACATRQRPAQLVWQAEQCKKRMQSKARGRRGAKRVFSWTRMLGRFCRCLSISQSKRALELAACKTLEPKSKPAQEPKRGRHCRPASQHAAAFKFAPEQRIKRAAVGSNDPSREGPAEHSGTLFATGSGPKRGGAGRAGTMAESPTDSATLPDANEESTKSAGNAKGIVHLPYEAPDVDTLDITQLSFEFISAERCAKETGGADAPETNARAVTRLVGAYIPAPSMGRPI